MNASLVARFNQELNICIHERDRHGDIATIGEYELRMITELLDETENIILGVSTLKKAKFYPSTTVQSRRMISQFIDEFIHFECGRNCLNKTSASNRAPRHADPVLRHAEDVIPEPCFKITLHLGKIKVRSSSCFHEFMGVVEEVKSKVKDAATDRFRVDEEMFLVQMPPTGTMKLE